MIKATNYKGIIYVRISELPEEQQSAISNWANDDIIIKIQDDKTLMRDCVLYKDYQHWFENIFTNAVADSPETTTDNKEKANALRKIGLPNPKHL